MLLLNLSTIISVVFAAVSLLWLIGTLGRMRQRRFYKLDEKLPDGWYVGDVGEGLYGPYITTEKPMALLDFPPGQYEHGVLHVFVQGGAMQHQQRVHVRQ